MLSQHRRGCSPRSLLHHGRWSGVVNTQVAKSRLTLGFANQRTSLSSIAVAQVPDVLSKAPSRGRPWYPDSLQSLPVSVFQGTYGGLFPGLQEIAQAWPVPWGVPSVILTPHLPEKSSPEKACVGLDSTSSLQLHVSASVSLRSF